MCLLLCLEWSSFGRGRLGSGRSSGRCVRFLLLLESRGFVLTEVFGLGRRYGRLVLCDGLKLGGGRIPALILVRRRGRPFAEMKPNPTSATIYTSPAAGASFAAPPAM